MLLMNANTQEPAMREERCDPKSGGEQAMCAEPSSWSVSAAKRVFDCACVLLALPVLLPAAVAVAMVVRFTSPGPVLFLQKRAGRRGHVFTIIKFRTMIDLGIHAHVGIHASEDCHYPITTRDNQRFTLPGPFLRRWKLDELPQLLNVLLGDMSLVGPRPKMPEHAIHDLECRPGLTGMATLAFAEEEAILARVPAEQLDDCFYRVVLPAKWQIDAQYMERATFLTDVRILVKSVLRRWETTAAEELLGVAAGKMEGAERIAHASAPNFSGGQISTSPATLL
jgi:lipopolysaccharide/colanic/teichoic acid biosynthesis glycosyltransferase